MKQMKLDENWDLPLTNYNFPFVTGLDALVQKIKSRLLTFYGEWFLNVTVGIQYMDYVFIKNPSIQVIEAIFADCIRNTTGVTKLVSMSSVFDRAERKLTTTFTVETVYGTTTDEVTV